MTTKKSNVRGGGPFFTSSKDKPIDPKTKAYIDDLFRQHKENSTKRLTEVENKIIMLNKTIEKLNGDIYTIQNPPKPKILSDDDTSQPSFLNFYQAPAKKGGKNTKKKVTKKA